MGFNLALSLLGCQPQQAPVEPRDASQDFLKDVRDAYLDVDRLTDDEVAALASRDVPQAATIVDAFAKGLNDDDFLSEEEKQQLVALGICADDVNLTDWQGAWTKRWAPYLHTEYCRLDSQSLADALVKRMVELDFSKIPAELRGTLATEASTYYSNEETEYFETQNARDREAQRSDGKALLIKLFDISGREAIPAAMNLFLLAQKYPYASSHEQNLRIATAEFLGKTISQEDRSLIPALLSWYEASKQYDQSSQIKALMPGLLKIADKRSLPLLQCYYTAFIRPGSYNSEEEIALNRRVTTTFLEWKNDPKLYAEGLGNSDEVVSMFCFEKLARQGASQYATLKTHIESITNYRGDYQAAESKGEKVLLFASVGGPEIEAQLRLWISQQWTNRSAFEETYLAACGVIGLAKNYPQSTPEFLKTLPKDLGQKFLTTVQSENSHFKYTDRERDILKQAAAMF